MSNGESVVSNATIAQRAEALEKKEAEGTAGKSKEGDTGAEHQDDAAAAAKVKADKEASDKAATEKAESDRKAAEDAAKTGKGKDKKAPNDPDELRKWNTRASQENKKLRDELTTIRKQNEDIAKALASLSKEEVDLKDLVKDPEKLKSFIEQRETALREEYETRLTTVEANDKAKDIFIGRMRREGDTENYPEWKRLYPSIIKLATGPTGTGDPRVDFTKSADDVLDALYEIALQENPKGTEPEVKPPTEKTYTETEMKAMIADMVSKEKDAIAKTAREEALREAQGHLSDELKGGTVASAGKGSGRVPTDQLAAFKKMTLAQQREWLIAQQEQK